MARVFKISFEDDLRRWTSPATLTYVALLEKVNDLFSVENPVLKYVDEDGDHVTLACEEDLNECLLQPVPTVRMFVSHGSPKPAAKVDPQPHPFGSSGGNLFGCGNTTSFGGAFGANAPSTPFGRATPFGDANAFGGATNSATAAGGFNFGQPSRVQEPKDSAEEARWQSTRPSNEDANRGGFQCGPGGTPMPPSVTRLLEVLAPYAGCDLTANVPFCKLGNFVRALTDLARRLPEVEAGQLPPEALLEMALEHISAAMAPPTSGGPNATAPNDSKSPSFKMEFAQYGMCRFEGWRAECIGDVTLEEAKEACLADPSALFFDIKNVQPDTGLGNAHIFYDEHGRSPGLGIELSLEDAEDNTHQTWRKVPAPAPTTGTDPASTFQQQPEEEEEMEPAVHHGVTCDGCNMSPIVGPRFKSLSRHDFDLCAKCEASGEHRWNGVYQRYDRPKPRGCPTMGPTLGMGGAGLPGGPPWRRGGPRWGFGGCSMPPPPGACKQFARGPAGAGARGGGGKATPWGRKSGLAARYVTDVTLFDGTEVPPGARVTKIWKLRNIGEASWPEGTCIHAIGGDALACAAATPLTLPEGGLPPGAEIDVPVDLCAPNAPGRFVAYFRLQHPSGQRFGQRVWCLLHVTVPVAHGDDAASSEDEIAELAQLTEEHAAAVAAAAAQADAADSAVEAAAAAEAAATAAAAAVDERVPSFVPLGGGCDNAAAAPAAERAARAEEEANRREAVRRSRAEAKELRRAARQAAEAAKAGGRWRGAHAQREAMRARHEVHLESLRARHAAAQGTSAGVEEQRFEMRFAQHGQCRFDGWHAVRLGHVTLEGAKEACLADDSALFFDIKHIDPANGIGEAYLFYDQLDRSPGHCIELAQDDVSDVTHQTWRKVPAPVPITPGQGGQRQQQQQQAGNNRAKFNFRVNGAEVDGLGGLLNAVMSSPMGEHLRTAAQQVQEQAERHQSQSQQKQRSQGPAGGMPRQPTPLGPFGDILTAMLKHVPPPQPNSTAVPTAGDAATDASPPPSYAAAATPAAAGADTVESPRGYVQGKGSPGAKPLEPAAPTTAAIAAKGKQPEVPAESSSAASGDDEACPAATAPPQPKQQQHATEDAVEVLTALEVAPEALCRAVLGRHDGDVAAAAEELIDISSQDEDSEEREGRRQQEEEGADEETLCDLSPPPPPAPKGALATVDDADEVAAAPGDEVADAVASAVAALDPSAGGAATKPDSSDSAAAECHSVGLGMWEGQDADDTDDPEFVEALYEVEEQAVKAVKEAKEAQAKEAQAKAQAQTDETEDAPEEEGEIEEDDEEEDLVEVAAEPEEGAASDGGGSEGEWEDLDAQSWCANGADRPIMG